MNKKVRRILKETGMGKAFVFMLILRAPFDFLNAILASNMLENFIRIAEEKNEEHLLQSFGLFLLLTFLLFGYNMLIWATISMKVNIRFQKRLRMRICKALLSRNQQEMEEISAGDWISRLNSDTDRTDDYLMAPVNFMHMVIAMVSLCLTSSVLLVLNKMMLGVSLLILLPFFFLSSIVVIRKIPIFKKKAREEFACYTNWMEPVIASADVISVFDGDEIVLKKAEEESLNILRNNMKAHKRTALSVAINTFSGNLGYILLLIIGNSMMESEVKDFARMTKITQYRGEMMRDVMVVNSCISRMKMNLSGAERVEEIL